MFHDGAVRTIGNAGTTPEKLETTATVTFEKLDPDWTVTNILLDVRGKVPKADQAAWDKATQAAKAAAPFHDCSIRPLRWKRNWRHKFALVAGGASEDI